MWIQVFDLAQEDQDVGLRKTEIPKWRLEDKNLLFRVKVRCRLHGVKATRQRNTAASGGQKSTS